MGTGAKNAAGRALAHMPDRTRGHALARSGGNSGKWGSCRRWRSSGQQAIRYDCYRLSPAELLVGLAKGAAICGLLSYTFYRAMAAFWMMLPLGCLFPLWERRRLMERRLWELASQFKESMVILASHLSAGYAMENAIAVSSRELAMLYGEDGLITGEFAYMDQQIRMNRPIEEVLDEFARRSGLEDVRSFAEVFQVAKRSGGDLSGIMRHTAEVIRDKMQVKEEIRTMTASKRFEQRIMNMIPFLIVVYVDASSPGFFSQMYGTGLGRILMSGCLAMYLVSFLLAWWILRIQV